jgi:hypothetical protein
MCPDSLWGDVESLEPIKTPISFLREQAQALTEKTKGVLLGDVSLTKELAFFTIDLSIVAPSLGDYRYAVLTARHAMGLYPVHVDDNCNRISYKCDSEDVFLGVLAKILSSEGVRQVLRSLLSQSISLDSTTA